MVKNIQMDLVDFMPEINRLISLVDNKIAKNLYLTINEPFKKDYYQLNHEDLETLLRTINFRMQKCQMIKETYFDTVEHYIICRKSSDLSISVNAKYNSSGSLIEESFSVNDPNTYQELLEHNFQVYILLVSALFENLVRLKEITLRKVILHVNKERQSTTMVMYREFSDHLLRLKYREEDGLSACLNSHAAFFDKFLNKIAITRNSIIHGFTRCLIPFDGDLTVAPRKNDSFLVSDPYVVVDVFITSIYDGILAFVKDVLNLLIRIFIQEESRIPY